MQSRAIEAAMLPVIDLTKSYGPVVIGIILSCILYGMSCVQTILYSMNFAKDRFWLKCLVGFNLILGATHLAAQIATMYTHVVKNFGNILGFAVLDWGGQSVSLLSSLIIVVIQGFFLFRLYLFSKSWILLAVLTPLVLTTFGLGLTSAGRVFEDPEESAIAKLKDVNLSNDVLLMVTDLTIAGTLAFYLRKTSPTAVASTNTVIAELIKYTIATGALTGTIALVGLIVRLAAPATTANVCLYYIIPGMYSNALLATLNLRQVMAQAWKDGPSVELSTFRDTEPKASTGVHSSSQGTRDPRQYEIALTEGVKSETTNITHNDAVKPWSTLRGPVDSV